MALPRSPASTAAVSRIGTRQMAEPRSGSRAISRNSTPTAAPGASKSESPRLSLRDSEKTLATSRATTILASSEGWIWTGPSCSQRRVPAIRGP